MTRTINVVPGTKTGDIPQLEFKSGENGIVGFNVLDDNDGIVEAFVSITGVEDKVKDVIQPGSYAKTLKTRKPKGLVNHDWAQPVSKVLEIKELLPGDTNLPKELPDGTPWPDEAGALYVKAQYNLATTGGRDAYENAKFYGNDQEWSIGYNVPADKFTKSNGVRYIKELELYEFSQVLWGAMPLARTLTVKADDTELEEKEVRTRRKPVRSRVVDDDLDDVDDDDIDDLDDDADDDEDVLDFDDDEMKELPHDVVNAIVAFKGYAAFLRAAGYEDGAIADLAGVAIPELKVIDQDAIYDSFADAVDQTVKGLIPDSNYEEIMELADQFDYSLLTDDGDVISAAEDDAVKAFRDVLEVKEEAAPAIRDLATVLSVMIENGTEQKRFFDREERDELAKSGAAMPDGSFPIRNARDLHNAINLVGRAKNPDEAKKHIIKRAEELNLTDDLPAGWDAKSDSVVVELKDFAELEDMKSLVGMKN